MNKAICIINCSPRVSGNSEYLSALLATSFVSIDPEIHIDILALRDYNIRGCIACGYCAKQVEEGLPPSCVLDFSPNFVQHNQVSEEIKGDDVAKLFKKLASSSLVIFVSPIYFYHLPATFKAFLDRMQRYWTLMPDEKPGLGELPVGLALIAARRAGSRIFDGSILSVRYACECMGMRLAGSLQLTGYDEPKALVLEPNITQQAKEFALETLTWLE